MQIIENTSSKHIVFYYFGYEHLLLNLFYYVLDAIKNNELVRFSVSPELYDDIKINFIYKEGLPKKYFKYCPAIGTIDKFATNYNDLEKFFHKCIESAMKEGFNGIKCIGDIKYEIENSSKEKVISGEKKLSSIFNNINDASMLCLYDMVDYLNNNETINDEIVYSSYDTHPYILHKFQINPFNGGF